MYFFEVVFKSVMRRKFRSALTAIGVAVAITAVVALLGISGGLQQSAAKQYEGRGVDLIVVRAGVAQRHTSTLAERIKKNLADIQDVRDVMPCLREVISLGDARTQVYGWPADSFGVKNLRLTSGSPFESDARDEVLLGSSLAERLKSKVGDTVEIEMHDFKVKGIFKSYNVLENGAAVVPLADLQKLMDREDQVSEFQVVLKKGRGDEKKMLERVERNVEELEDWKGEPLHLAALPTEAFAQTSTELRLARAMAWITSTIALIIGSVGVLNTMIMSVMERTQEIGILRAIGWRRTRIVRLVLGESMMLSITGAVIGVLAAIGLTRLLSEAPAVKGFVSGDISLEVIGNGLLLSLLVGLVGGLYPAIRAARLAPTEALRYE